MNETKTLSHTAIIEQVLLSKIGCNAKVLFVCSDIRTILNAHSDTDESGRNIVKINACLIADSEPHDVLISAAMGIRSVLSGKNNHKSIPEKATYIVDENTVYEYWFNTLEGMHIATLNILPFLSLNFQHVLEDNTDSRIVQLMQQLLIEDKSAYLRSSLQALTGAMRSARIRPVDVIVSSFVAVQLGQYESFKTPLTPQQFKDFLDNSEDPEIINLATAVKNASANIELANQNGSEVADEKLPYAIDRVTFSNAILKLTSEYANKAVEYARKQGEVDTTSLLVEIEKECIAIKRAHCPIISKLYESLNEEIQQ